MRIYSSSKQSSRSASVVATRRALGLARLLLGFSLLFPTGLARADSQTCLAAHEQSQRLRLENQLLAAREQLLICAQPDCPKLVSDDCVGWLAEVEASVASVVFAVSDHKGNDITDAKVFRGETVLAENTAGHALNLDPGSYELRFEYPGFVPVNLQIAIRQSEKNRILRVQLQPLPLAPVVAAKSGGRPSVPIATYVLGAVALASAGLGTYFAIAGKSEYDELSHGCSPKCTGDQVADGKRDYVLADVAFGVAAASAIAGTIIFFTGRETPNTSAPTSVQAAITPHTAYLQLQTRL